MKTLTAIAMALAAPAIAAPLKTHMPVPKAAAILAAAKQATGGDRWNSLQGCREEGTHGDGRVLYTTWFSLERYGMRMDGQHGGETDSRGYDGRIAWQSDDDGHVTINDDKASRAEAIITDYLSINGFFFPGRFPATIRYLREASAGERSFDVIEVRPQGSRPIDIWFDRTTHLIGRVVDKTAMPPLTVDAGDYREMDGLTIATRLTIYGPGGEVGDEGRVTSFRCGPIDATIFDPPKPR